MTSPLLAFALKLPLALLVFLVIAYAGTTDKRIAGVLFTFPILNGVAIIASPEPVVVADAIYPLVIFNCVLFASVISFAGKLPPVAARPRGGRLFARVAAWSLAWLAGAWLITDFRAAIPGALVLFVIASIVAIMFMLTFWTKQPRTEASRAAGLFVHWSRFMSFWGNGTGLARIAFFVLAYACLFFASRVALDEKWVGMASALPLPGFFALAALMDDAASQEAGGREKLLPIRDTLFLGPVLVIPFNWIFSHALASALPPAWIVARYVLLLALWAIAAFAVLLLVPRLEARLDRR
ncbi:MAG: hypothetical protein WDO17_01230 [Alphaproteobacteria bacterium]